MLMVDRVERRPIEACFRCLLKPVQYVSPMWMTTPVEILVNAMINNTVYTDRNTIEIIENPQIFHLATIDKTKNIKNSLLF